MKSLSFALTLSLLACSANLFAADPLKIGMITTLSTKAGYLGEDVRDGFNLALAMQDGKLGGVPVEVLVEDDERKPAKGKQVADRMIKRDGVQLMTGIIFSNVAVATIPAVTREDVVYLSPNAGPSNLAGKNCDKNYFNVAWQNDNLHEAMGQFVTDEGHKKLYILAPNYPAGKDALTGFKRYYKGEIVGETYTKLGQSDYAAELATIRSANPDGVFFFLPGGMGINFVKQYAQAGLNKTVPLFGPAFSFDARLLKAVGDAAVGVRNSSQWNQDLDNPANKAFVEAFVKAYGRMPTLYASQGYDTARLIDAALTATGGDLSDKDAFRAAL
ncbi:MAG: ABC transporter substrate-binding protein, partial [Gammaproteobacteria bacterium]|nr:ABC transporter substrate-binding protein [Gammaproteobacteria bacterium]